VLEADEAIPNDEALALEFVGGNDMLLPGILFLAAERKTSSEVFPYSVVSRGHLFVQQ
jgi:hypothetical protein